MSSLLLIVPLCQFLQSIAADVAGAAGSFRQAALWLAVASATVSHLSRRARAGTPDSQLQRRVKATRAKLYDAPCPRTV